MRTPTAKTRPHRQSRAQSLSAIDIDKCENLCDLLDALSTASFGAREVGRAWSVLKNVASDKECDIVLTVSGAMTVAKLGSIFGALISRGIIKAVVTTGAVVTHGLIEEMGMKHYRVPTEFSDADLFRTRFNRIYDTLEPESNLNALERSAINAFSELAPGQSLGSFEIVRYLSDKLLNNQAPDGFLRSAFKKRIDVYVPAFTDSELGLYLFRYAQSKRKEQQVIGYDAFKDLARYASWLSSRKRIAFLTLGGGVPRNWAQQMLPYLRSSEKKPSNKSLPKIVAAIRICPDQASLGHLSGSTYSEGITWGKFKDEDKTDFVEVACDATVVFPILAKALTTYWDAR